MHIPLTSRPKLYVPKELKLPTAFQLKSSYLPLVFNHHVHGVFRAVSSASSSYHDHEDFYRFTSGRWLWDEQKQLQQRYKKFNVHELIHVATRSVGAQKCVSITKLAEGGFNKVFRLVMDDKKVVIARIPNPNAGPSFKTTASEVATMDFVWCCTALGNCCRFR